MNSTTTEGKEYNHAKKTLVGIYKNTSFVLRHFYPLLYKINVIFSYIG